MSSQSSLVVGLESIGRKALRDLIRLLIESYRDAFNRVVAEFPADQHARMLPGERKGVIERDMEQVARKHKFGIEVIRVQGGHALRVFKNETTQGTLHYKKKEEDDLKKANYRKQLSKQCGKNNPNIFQPDVFGNSAEATYITFVHGIGDDGDRSQLGYVTAQLYDADHVLLAEEDVLAFCEKKSQKLVAETAQEQPRIIGLK